jgi:hypothetical protein
MYNNEFTQQSLFRDIDSEMYLPIVCSDAPILHFLSDTGIRYFPCPNSPDTDTQYLKMLRPFKHSSTGKVLTHTWKQQSKALHLSARGVTTVPGSNPGCITSGRDWESHRAAHNWPSVIQAVVVNKNLLLTGLPS